MPLARLHSDFFNGVDASAATATLVVPPAGKGIVAELNSPTPSALNPTSPSLTLP